MPNGTGVMSAPTVCKCGQTVGYPGTVRHSSAVGITKSVFSPAARPRWCDVGQVVVPRRWAKNVLD
jgi:hypothetical protein